MIRVLPALLGCVLLAPTLTAQDDAGCLGNWKVRLERPGWQPHTVAGDLAIARSEGRWSGRIRFRTVLHGREHALRDFSVKNDELTFAVDHADWDIAFKVRLKGRVLEGTCAWAGVGDCPFRAWRPGEEAVPDQRSSRALPALPADADVEAQVLGKLVERAEETHSDALIVWKDGRTIVDTTFGGPRRPIEAMSVTKSVASLAIAHLSGAGKLGLDTPVHTLYPEWDQGRKKSITVRHLLNHTSGLQADVHTREIYASPDFVKLALAAELVSDPGERFFYNNKAVNLLAGVVQRASGQPLDAYLAQHVFAPLGITDVTWTRDAAGNPHAMAGIQIHARDLLKLGQLMLDRGAWEGKQIIPATWVDEATSSGQEHQRACGLLWWLTPEWSKALIDDEVIAGWRETGMDEAFIRKILPLKDRLFAPGDYFAEIAKVLGGPVGLEEWYDMTWRAGRSDGKTVDGPVSGFSAKGYLGQFVVVRTRERIIAVRQIDAASHRGEEDGFNDFAALVQSL